ncbi:MAG: hypothetical protein NVS9B7_15950 [Flavisolibacter sp.]
MINRKPQQKSMEFLFEIKGPGKSARLKHKAPKETDNPISKILKNNPTRLGINMAMVALRPSAKAWL